jgi:Zn-dependent peptidase ImmA (M78 family)
MLRWARDRSGRSEDYFTEHFPKLPAWETGDVRPTLKQVEAFAKATYTPVGYLFLNMPPAEQVPIPDFRTIRDRRVGAPSPNLLEMLYTCQQRQAWYREFARIMGEPARAFVGSASTSDSVEAVADTMRQVLQFDLEARRTCPTWTDALRHFIAQADDLGVLVMCSGVVRNNNHRPLDPEEFRGFALSDPFAPLVFINGKDTKAAQMFTLAHELAHIWIGQSALSDAGAYAVPDHAIEAWCNRVAAELLAPLLLVQAEFRADEELDGELARLARRFKISTLVVLRRIYDAGGLSRDDFNEAYGREVARLCTFSGKGGGDFYLTQTARVSKRFARALVESTLEGHTLYRDAFHMLGVSRLETFNEMGRSVGVYA